ncbi:MAG: CDP-glucose 4,6-dehydratase [Deferribacteraceae bacterium]|jgi:CDP-glucose 4,6-dehydratase|nr:CDP-glucose 4,6-dehydratase [Deferribacteraceae bacterium]
MIDLQSFYKDKRVFVTGHTGFKGSWLCHVLALFGAKVIGYSLPAPTTPSLFELSGLKDQVTHIIGDVRELEHLSSSMNTHTPDIVIHMAAQPLVIESYKNPVDTYAINVMGTVNLLEAVRQCDSVKSVVNVTTDKVYKNNEWEWGYREDDVLNGYDPYSNSKSCSELVTDSYKKAFFYNRDIAISTCRAGNVIGGGDFSADRIIPDCVRAVQAGKGIVVRNPHSTRPYQHVLEPIMAYLMVAAEQYNNKELQSSYNVGPDDIDCVTTSTLVDTFCASWGDSAKWEAVSNANAPHEANFLKLDCSKIKKSFNWKPKWHIDEAIKKTVEWSKVYLDGGDLNICIKGQIEEYRVCKL